MAGLGKALNIINGWILDIVCHVVWTSFKTHGTCEETAFCRDLIQGVVGRPKPEGHQPMCDLKERLLVLLTRLEDGQQPTKFWYDLESTILEDAVDHLEAIKTDVTNMELNQDMTLLLDPDLELGLKQQAVFVCCSVNEFDRAQQVFERYWLKPQSTEETRLSKLIERVIMSKNPQHSAIKKRQYTDFLDDMKAALAVIFDCFETPFLIKAAEKVLNRVDVQERCSIVKTPDIVQERCSKTPDIVPESPRSPSPSLLQQLEFDLEAYAKTYRTSAGKLTGPSQRRILEDFSLSGKKGNSLNLKGEDQSRSEIELQKIWQNKKIHMEQIRQEFPENFITNALDSNRQHDLEQPLFTNTKNSIANALDSNSQHDLVQPLSANEMMGAGDHGNQDNVFTPDTTRKKQMTHSPRKKTPDKYFKKVTRDLVEANHKLESALQKFKRSMKSRNASEDTEDYDESEEDESASKRMHTNCEDNESTSKRMHTNCEDNESTSKRMHTNCEDSARKHTRISTEFEENQEKDSNDIRNFHLKRSENRPNRHLANDADGDVSSDGSQEDHTQLTMGRCPRLCKSLAPRREMRSAMRTLSGRGRRPWSEQETVELYRAVRAHGVGNWTAMLTNFNLSGRTNINLKDKWRTMVKQGKDKQLGNILD